MQGGATGEALVRDEGRKGGKGLKGGAWAGHTHPHPPAICSLTTRPPTEPLQTPPTHYQTPPVVPHACH